jgi:hypothetical protein
MRSILAAFAALMLSTGIAHADPEDSYFLAAVHKQGIEDDEGDAGLIKLGHMMCGLRADGYSTNALIQMGQLHGTKLSGDDVKVVVQSAEAAYCPQYIE